MTGIPMTGCDEAHTLLLHADLDGELDAGRAVDLAAHLAACPACTALRTALVAQRADIRALDYHRAPDTVRRRLTTRRWPIPAAVLAGAMAAGVAVALLPAAGSDRLLDSHLRALQPGHLVDVASTDQHNVKPWFDGRLDYAPPVKDLSASGFVLQGGRLDRLDGKPVAALVYRSRLHVIDVFVWPADRAPKPSRGGQGYNVRRWSQDGFVFDSVSDLAVDELDAFARAWQESRPAPT